MCDVAGEQDVDSLPLPKNWHSSVRNAVLNVIGIVRIAMLAGREALITNGDAGYADGAKQRPLVISLSPTTRFDRGFDASMTTRSFKHKRQ